MFYNKIAISRLIAISLLRINIVCFITKRANSGYDINNELRINIVCFIT